MLHGGRRWWRPGGWGVYGGPWHVAGGLGLAAVMEEVLRLHHLGAEGQKVQMHGLQIMALG